MNTLEQAPRFELTPDFGMELNMGGFDINAAFQGAISDVATDDELALDEKVRRMEVIVSEGTSEVYRDFVDFRQMAAVMEMMCNHDHTLNQLMQGNNTLFGFMDSHKADDGHNHGDSLHGKDDDDDDDEYDTDLRTGKRRKKRRG